MKDLEGVVTALASEQVNGYRVIPVNPTAIDEFRILSDGSYLHPALTSRWPIHQPQEGDLLYSLPPAPQGITKFANYEDFERRGLSTIFDPPIDDKQRRVGIPLSDPEVSGMLRTLRDAIQLQMAGRDHLLVRQSPGFFLYRPLYEEFEFSGGVANEIHTFDGIRKYHKADSRSRILSIAFVHSQSDAKGAFDTKEGNLFPDSVRQASAAITQAAIDLVKKNGQKTKRPSVPKDQTVAMALQAIGGMDAAAEKIHNELFPMPKEGSIGSEQPLALHKTKKTIKEVLEIERAKALSGAIDGKIHHTFSKDEVQWKLEPIDDHADTYVDVIENLDDADSTQRINAIKRVRAFFAKNASLQSKD